MTNRNLTGKRMDYLAEDRLRNLTAQRRKGLLKSVYTRIAQCHLGEDYKLDKLSPEDRELCEYKILIRRLIRELD